MTSEIITLIICTLAYLVYINGTVYFEAYAFHLKNHDKIQPYNPHYFLIKQRIVVILALSFIMTGLSFFTLANIVGLSMIYPYFHDGQYYKLRNKLHKKHNIIEEKYMFNEIKDIYPDNDIEEVLPNGDPYKAKFSYNANQRFDLAIVGLGILVCVVLVKLLLA